MSGRRSTSCSARRFFAIAVAMLVQLFALCRPRVDIALAEVRCAKVRSAGEPVKQTMRRGGGQIPSSYFGMHIHRAVAGTAWPRARIGAWRLWDAYAVWPWLEPARGKWRWNDLDLMVKLAETHRVEVLLPLGLSPAWASARPTEPSAYAPGLAAEPGELEDWRRYVETVVARYAGRVPAFEVWNEPNLKGFYSGSVEEMVMLCREAHAIVKRSDPRNIVVSPAATGFHGVEWLDRFLAAGGADCFDVVGYHLYVSPGEPEDVLKLIDQVRGVLTRHGIADRPLWNTESGWHIASKQPTPSSVQQTRCPLSKGEAAAYLARAMILARAAGIERFYWYSWDNYWMGLVERDGTAKPAAVAYEQLQRWLVGAELTGCRASGDGSWVCPLVRSGKRSWIVWNPRRSVSFDVPSSWQVRRVRDLRGGRRALRSAAISIGPLPQLLEER